MCIGNFAEFLEETVPTSSPSLCDSYKKAFCRNQTGERLEWLGDSVLGMVASEYLFRRFPGASEGVLSKARVKLVKGSTLYKFAIELGLERYVEEEHTEKVLADTFESFIAVIYLDKNAGISAVSHICSALFKLHFTDECLISDSNAKDVVNKCCRKLAMQPATYETEKTCTVPYEFLCIAYTGSVYATGYARSKKQAEQLAATSLAMKIADTHESCHEYVHVTREAVIKARRG